MDWIGKGNPYALAPWVRQTRHAKLPGDQVPGKRKPIMQLRARHHTLTLWKRFDKRFLQKKNAAIVFSNAKDGPTATTVYRLGLRQVDLHRLKDKFDLIDADDSGEVDYGEFLHIIGMRRSAYTDALFRMVDTDNSTSISFAEFVHMLGTYCTFDAEEIFTFVMQMFDINKEGNIDDTEYRLLRSSVTRAVRKKLPRTFQAVLKQFDHDGDGQLSATEFRGLCEAYPSIMSPAQRLQLHLRKVTLGARRWRAILADMVQIARARNGLQTKVAQRLVEEDAKCSDAESDKDGDEQVHLPCVGVLRRTIPTLRRKLIEAVHGNPQVRYGILAHKDIWRDVHLKESREYVQNCKSVLSVNKVYNRMQNSCYQSEHMDDEQRRSRTKLALLDATENASGSGSNTDGDDDNDSVSNDNDKCH